MDDSNRNSEIGALWDAAVIEYNKTAGVKSVVPVQARTIDQVMAVTIEKEDYFKHWRNDKGKLDKLRGVLKASLGPLDALGQFVSAQASVVSDPLPLMQVSCEPPAGLSSKYHNHDCHILHDTGAPARFRSCHALGLTSLQTANRVSADYDLLVTFFDELRLFLERLKLIDGHIPESQDIRRCLVDILTLILKIIGMSVKTMKSGRGCTLTCLFFLLALR